MPQSYHFKCENGHDFDAVAKRYSRCPQCGQGTRRNFLDVSTSDHSTNTQKPTHSETSEKPDTSDSLSDTQKKAETLSSSVPGSKRSTTSAAESGKSSTLVKQSVRVLKRGRMPTTPKKTAPKKVVVKSTSPVSRHKAPANTAPTVTKKPVGTREHKTLEENTGPYWNRVKKKFFI